MQSSQSRNAFAKVQKVFGFTSGKGEKFGLGQEKSLKTKKVPKYLELIERFHIFAPSECRQRARKRFPPLAFVARFFQAGPF